MFGQTHQMIMFLFFSLLFQALIYVFLLLFCFSASEWPSGCVYNGIVTSVPQFNHICVQSCTDDEIQITAINMCQISGACTSNIGQ